MRPAQRDASTQVTVRVARDGTGAPVLGERYVPLGSVYQFTPLGWTEDGLEIRVPFSGASSAPVLLIADAGGDWTEVSNARRDGGFMVARVPQLAYATVADVAGVKPSFFGTASSSSAVSLALNGAASIPTLPVPREGTVELFKPTSLVLDVRYAVPAGCTVAPTVKLSAMVAIPQWPYPRIVTVGQRTVNGTSGKVQFTLPLSVSDNGTWTFVSNALCKEPGAAAPRYTFVSTGPNVKVSITNNTTQPAPIIGAGPQSANVSAGSLVTFSVTAQGSALSYEWQRSNDGGANYAPLNAVNAPSYSLGAALSDNGALFRVRVSNAYGSTLSTPAKLTVAARVIAPTITSAPAHQTVLEGETASFSVAGTGQPAPTIQWQRRAAPSADPEAGWVAIAGATASTYTTPATSVAQSGAQYRALLGNAGGTAATLPASLTVKSQVVAPGIVSDPQSVSVIAGQFGALAVTASGTSPLSYQWFKNGQAIAGANASEVLVAANAIDAGGRYDITVQVSNAAGKVMSAPAVMSITAVPPVPPVGTLVKAGEAGVIPAGLDASLVVPPGALASDTVIGIVQQAQASVAMPADFTAMSDSYDISPAGLVFAAPVVFTFPAPDTVPAGTVLALVELPSASSAVRANRVSVSSVELKRLAVAKTSYKADTIAAIDGADNVWCTTPQNSRGGALVVNLSRAARYVTAAVPESACQGTARAPSRTLIPSTTTDACKGSDFAASDADSQIGLVSRHVSCIAGRLGDTSFFELPSTANNNQSRSYGSHRLEWRVGSHGPAKDLNKTYRLSFRLTKVSAPEAGEAPGSLTLTLRPTFQCGVTGSETTATGGCTHPRSVVSVTAGTGWSAPMDMLVDFNWSTGTNTYAVFSPLIQVWYALPGENVDGITNPVTGIPLSFVYLDHTTPSLRCDKGMSANGGNGCVYPTAPAVMVLLAGDLQVKEAAEHIREVQRPSDQGGIGALGGLDIAADGNATAYGGKALQRTRVTGLRGGNAANRNHACGYADSIIRQKPAASASCKADGTGTNCSCDEYPFNSTWNGAFLNRDGTAARYINYGQNVEAGRRLGRFYHAERVLDYTPDPGIGYLRGQNEASSVTSRTGGDDFWVHIE